MASNGCEANLKTDPNNCGGCGKTCTDGGSCVNGACECAGVSAEAKLIPLDMYIMFDKSGSMQGANWNSATAALKQFIQSPQSAGMGVGLDFFPASSACSVMQYSTPTVPIGVLPGNAMALINAINATTPSGNTPTTPA
ncbi:MAG: VWA domain-containing protein, partial [Polyangiaceae bacterium]|nr:VWA domain-containing protein [Polyangiaceae bacterium]